MARLKKEIKCKVIEGIKLGKSINKIAYETHLSKGTIYYYYKKIMGRKIPLVKIPENDCIIGEFLGAFAGDGSFFHDKKKGHYSIRIHLHAKDDFDYSMYLKDLIKSNFRRKVGCYIKDNSLTLRVYSKEIYHFIDDYLMIKGNKTLNVCLKNDINSFSENFLKFFVRGLIDTDGHVRKDGRITISLITRRLINQVSDFLTKLGINNQRYIRKKRSNEHVQHDIMINKVNSRKYLQLIGFSNKRKEKNAVAGI